MTMPPAPPQVQVQPPLPVSPLQPPAPQQTPPDGMGAPSPMPGVPPPAVPAPPPPPPAPQAPPPPTISPDAKLKARARPEDIKNHFERQATMIIDGADDYARRLANNLSEQAVDTLEADDKTVNEMMHFSRYGADAPRVFWEVHDRILAQAVQADDPDPYAAAERGALDEVYPYRAKLALLDVLGPDERVARAQQLMNIADRRHAKGETPAAMRFLTTPSALQQPVETQPAPQPTPSSPPPSTNGSY